MQAVRGAPPALDELIYEEIALRRERARPRRAHRRALDAAARARRGRPRDDRRRAARRARHAAGRRPRDDRHRPGVGVRAAAAQPGRARPPACARWPTRTTTPTSTRSSRRRCGPARSCPGIGRVVRGRALRGGRLRDPRRASRSTPRSRRSTAAPTATRSQHAFRPERFLGPDAPDTYTWLPFGGGTRRCLGASFATFEMRVVIRRVLERADLAAVGRPPEKSVRKGVTIVPKRRVRVVQIARFGP